MSREGASRWSRRAVAVVAVVVVGAAGCRGGSAAGPAGGDPGGTGPVCGNGRCESGESCSSCAQDCSCTGSWPTDPPARICGNAAVLDAGPTSAPAGAIAVPAGDNSRVDFGKAGATYWFAPGVHTLGTGEYDQIIPGDGATFVGAPGAILDGQGKNRFAFTQHAKNVTIRYLTIRNFDAPQDQGVVNHDSGIGWTIERCTLRDNHGAALMMGSGNTLRESCLADNGQYGFNAFQCENYGGDDCANQGPGTGTRVQNLVLEGNEIRGNTADDLETRNPGCGCTGGGKFWDVDGAVVRGNWVHDNKSVGLWADTNDRNFLFEGNYIADNADVGLFYEISYNARIVHNAFLRNALVQGKQNPGFPVGAIYLSESGGDANLPALAPANTTFSTTTLDVTENYFEDNWSGVVIWENADRYCASPNNTSSGYCTLYFGAGYDTSRCGQGQISSNLDRCRWKSQNITVSGNVFKVRKANIGCSGDQDCALNAVFSNYGTSPSWSPYQAYTVCEAITFQQHNVFRDNTYAGDWSFMPYATDRRLGWSAWRAAPYGQDAGSTLAP